MKAVIGEKNFKGIPALLLLVFVVNRSCVRNVKNHLQGKKNSNKKTQAGIFSFYEFF